MPLHVGKEHPPDGGVGLGDLPEELGGGHPLLEERLRHGGLENGVDRLQGAHEVRQDAQFGVGHLHKPMLITGIHVTEVIGDLWGCFA